MKNGKFLFLLVLILCFTVFLVACDGGEDATDTSAESTNAVTPPQDVEQDNKKYEMLDYFVLDEEQEAFVCEPIAKYNGMIVDSDVTHNIVALKTQDLDVYNRVTDTITLYDMLTGETLLTFDATYPLYVEDEQIELSVDIEYPVVRAVKKSYSEDSEMIVFDASYYPIKKDAKALHTTSFYKSDEAIAESWVNVFGNGLVSVNAGDKVIWIDRDMEIVRTVNAIAANGYTVESFNSEYQGYLYSWDDQMLQVFNRNGICSGTYKIDHKGFLNVHVLDNGNVLIQDFEEVDIHTAYNVMLGTNRYLLTSYVMNLVDGALTEQKLDFVVSALQTAYAQDCAAVTLDEGELYLPFKLAQGRDNQAIVYRFNDAGKVAKNQEYVVLSNALEIEYTVKNTTEGIDFVTAYPISANLYYARVNEAGIVIGYIFDPDGNVVSPANSEFFVTKSYIVTQKGIYDHKMKLLYDAKANGFEVLLLSGDRLTIDTDYDVVYLSKHNFVTGLDEIYVYDAKTAEPKLFHADKDETFRQTISGGYITYNAEKGTYNLYNLENELKLSIVQSMGEPFIMNNVFLIQTTLDRKPVTFVVK